jgi:hypothetical protein
LPGQAARCYTEAFALQPEAADSRNRHRYEAACCAALACCGGNDGARLDAEEKGRLRKQALAWLRADLKWWSTHLDKNPGEARSLLPQVLPHWQRDPSLTGLRERSGLASLSEVERQDWDQLWAAVQKLLDRSRATDK